MTQQLKDALEAAARLPEVEQDDLARRIMADIGEDVPDHERTFGPFAELVAATDWP